MGVEMVAFHVHHGGRFERINDHPNPIKLVYAEGECTVIEMDPDLLEVKGLKEDTMQFGYSKDRITNLF